MSGRPLVSDRAATLPDRARTRARTRLSPGRHLPGGTHPAAGRAGQGRAKPGRDRGRAGAHLGSRTAAAGAGVGEGRGEGQGG